MSVIQLLHVHTTTYSNCKTTSASGRLEGFDTAIIRYIVVVIVVVVIVVIVIQLLQCRFRGLELCRCGRDCPSCDRFSPLLNLRHEIGHVSIEANVTRWLPGSSRNAA
eukprot:scaffold121_cov412-Prasinococcus_capsulatus_cf.AAC.23